MTNKTREARARLLHTLQTLGFTFDEAMSLIRIEMTLHRWDELECGDSNDYCSWCISRDEDTGKPYMERSLHSPGSRNTLTPIPDREKGALKRCQKILDARNARPDMNPAQLEFYHQSDCRGAALYIIRPGDFCEGQSVESYYSRGICVCGR